MFYIRWNKQFQIALILQFDQFVQMQSLFVRCREECYEKTNGIINLKLINSETPVFSTTTQLSKDLWVRIIYKFLSFR